MPSDHELVEHRNAEIETARLLRHNAARIHEIWHALAHTSPAQRLVLARVLAASAALSQAQRVLAQLPVPSSSSASAPTPARTQAQEHVLAARETLRVLTRGRAGRDGREGATVREGLEAIEALIEELWERDRLLDEATWGEEDSDSEDEERGAYNAFHQALLALSRAQSRDRRDLVLSVRASHPDIFPHALPLPALAVSARQEHTAGHPTWRRSRAAGTARTRRESLLREVERAYPSSASSSADEAEDRGMHEAHALAKKQLGLRHAWLYFRTGY